MSLPIVLRDEAEAEFDQAFDWYDSQRVGLGAEFAAERIKHQNALQLAIAGVTKLDGAGRSGRDARGKYQAEP